MKNDKSEGGGGGLKEGGGLFAGGGFTEDLSRNIFMIAVGIVS